MVSGKKRGPRALRGAAIVRARRALLQLAIGYLQEASIDRWAIDMGLRATWVLDALGGVRACSVGLRGEARRQDIEDLRRRVESLCKIAEIAGRGLSYQKTHAGRSVARQALKAALVDMKRLARLYP